MAIKSSPRLALLLLLSHAIVVIVVYVAAMPLATRLVLLVPILLSLYYYLARDVLLLCPDSWRDISFDQGGMSVVTRDGSVFSGKIACKITISPYFAVLGVRPEGCRLTVFQTICPDALDVGAFRELSVQLRFA